MKQLSWAMALVAVAMSGAALAEHGWRGADVCGAGPAGDRPAGMDADGDAVPDSEDWCPRSAPGARVGANGCGEGEIVTSCVQARQPEPARVVPVSAAPASGDADGDGVADKEDKCPGTPRRAEVDDNGCVVIEKVVLKGVSFATGSAKLKPEASVTLLAVAGAMKANGDIEVEIRGYTDSVGEDAKNQALSERRAKAVKDFLVKNGVDAGRLETKGYGEADPVDSNDTPEGRANNRRVEFKID